jgi:hypothetical protein
MSNKDSHSDRVGAQLLLERIIDLPLASHTDLALATAAIEDILRRIRSETLPDLTWESEDLP